MGAYYLFICSKTYANKPHRTHNGFANDKSKKYANGQVPVKVDSSIAENNGAPRAGTHEEYYKK